MSQARKRTPTVAKPLRKVAVKRKTFRDVRLSPTAKQIDESLVGGTTLKLEDFVKGVKL